MSEKTEKPTPEAVEAIQRKIRHLERVQVVGGGKPGDTVNEGRKEQAKGMRNVLREAGKKR